jgi:hypothetical protein
MVAANAGSMACTRAMLHHSRDLVNRRRRRRRRKNPPSYLHAG